MLLNDIITLTEQENGAKFLFDEDTLVVYANQIQKMAYTKDLEAFKTYATLTIFHEISMASTPYTNAVDGDLDKNVLGATSGAIGVLKDYDNSTKVWHVAVTSGEFSEGESVTIQTGTGAGVVEESEIFKGPYSVADLEIPCRKILGVTAITDAQIYGSESIVDEEGDYGAEAIKDIQRNFWELGRVNHVRKTFTFASTPVLTEEYYRWVYFMAAPTIEDVSDDENLILPEEFHYSVLYNGVIALSDNATYGEKPTTPDQILFPYLNQFWTAMGDHYLDVGDDNHRSIGW